MPFPNEPTQFKPGQSGNPKGRPRKRPLSDLLAEKLVETADGADAPWDDRLVMALLTTAVGGDVAALKEVFNRLEGKVPDRVTHGEDATPTRKIRDRFGSRTEGRPGGAGD